MPVSGAENLHKFAYQFSLRGLPARRIAEFGRWWMGVNHQTTTIAYNPETNEVRIAMLIEATSRDQAVRAARDQLTLLKQDVGDQAPDVPAPILEWPDWGDAMIWPLLHSREHGEFPPGCRKTQEPPPDLVAALEAMAASTATTQTASEGMPHNERISILLRPAPPGLYESLGQIAAHGAGLEQALGDLMAQLARVIGTAPQKADPLAHYRGRLRDLVKAAKAAADAAGGYIGTDVLNATRDFLSRVEAVLDIRNQFIHSQWWLYTDSDGSERLICRRLPQSSQETEPIEWQVDKVQDLLGTGRYFMDLDQQARFLVARLMTLADRIQGVEDASGSVQLEIDVGGLTEEERVAILRRLHAGLPPRGLEFLGPVTNVRHDTEIDANTADQPRSLGSYRAGSG